MVLAPHVGSDLAARLLVHRAGMLGLGELVRHGAAEHDIIDRGARRFDLDGDAHVEAATDP